MRRPSPIRGGDEGDLLKQIMLLELLEWLAPSQGEFWYLESHSGEGHTTADLPALDWYASASQQPAGGWQSFPLWNQQEASLSVGQYMGSSALALRLMAGWETRGVNVRWVFSHNSHERAYQFQELCSQWSDEGILPFHRPSHRARMLQLFGAGLDGLQEMVYLGAARAPGLALLEPPTLAGLTSSLTTLIETLLLRRFWVMLVLPVPFAGNQKRQHSALYASLYDAVEQMQAEGWRYTLTGRSSSWKPGAVFETWLIAPAGDMGLLRNRIWERMSLLLGDALGRRRGGDQLAGVEVLPFQNRPKGLALFLDRFPIKLRPQLEIDIARDSDMPEVISLWEQLMDEHASFDEHFRRRPLARLYLRHSLSSQLNQPEYLLLVIRWRRQAIGFLSAQVLRAPLFQESRIGQIVDVFILSEWRNQQLGSQLVELATQWFRALQITQIDLNVAVHNKAGRLFWERQGLSPYLHVLSKELD